MLMKGCPAHFQAVLRRRDNMQVEFQTKNEALLSRKVDQEVVREPTHTHTHSQTHKHRHAYVHVH